MKKIFLVLVLVFLLIIPMTQGQDGEAEVSQMLNAGAESVILGDLLLEEPFDAANAWEQFSGPTSDLRVEDGTYHIDVEGSSIIWGLREIEHTDVVINIEAGQLSPDNVFSGYGVMCRADTSNNGEGYYFFIRSDGTALISVGTNSSIESLVKPVSSNAIHTGSSTNIITAVCKGTYLALYVNGELIVETTDATFASGYAGIAAHGDEDAAAQVSFDNAMIWDATKKATRLTISEGKYPDAKPETLQYHDAENWRDAVEELENEGLIGSGGTLVFNEPYTYFAGQGDWFTPLARNSPFSDIVMAGEITFMIGNSKEFEVCSLSARIQTNADYDAERFIDVGILNTGGIIIVDRFSPSVDATVEFVLLNLDLDETNHLLYILQDDLITIYVNGELVKADFEVRDRTGTYGIGLRGRGPNARCEGRNVWVYQVPVFREGVCEANAPNNVNRREGPGTNYATPGQMTAGTIIQVTGQTTGDDGFTWWQLEDDSWVRDDIVNVSGDCAGVPQTD